MGVVVFFRKKRRKQARRTCARWGSRHSPLSAWSCMHRNVDLPSRGSSLLLRRTDDVRLRELLSSTPASFTPALGSHGRPSTCRPTVTLLLSSWSTSEPHRALSFTLPVLRPSPSPLTNERVVTDAPSKPNPSSSSRLSFSPAARRSVDPIVGSRVGSAKRERRLGGGTRAALRALESSTRDRCSHRWRQWLNCFPSEKLQPDETTTTTTTTTHPTHHLPSF